MATDTRTTLTDLLKYVEENVKEAFEYSPDADPSDVAFEVAEGLVPVYTGDLLEMAADNYSLAVDTPELGPAFDGSPTPVNIIAANVFERLNAEAWEVIRKLGKDI